MFETSTHRRGGITQGSDHRFRSSALIASEDSNLNVRCRLPFYATVLEVDEHGALVKHALKPEAAKLAGRFKNEGKLKRCTGVLAEIRP